MIDQEKLDKGLVTVHNHFSQKPEATPLPQTPEFKEVLAVLCQRKLIHADATRMQAGNLRIRWTSTQALTALGKERLLLIQPADK